ncbi:MAG: TolC family protein [Bacteroidales bacterium]|nr:TolC family protein [Bacteroidales bacterium]
MIKKALITISFLFVLLFVAVEAQNQEPVTYTLSDYRTEALNYSLQLKQSAATTKYYDANRKTARSNFFPQIDFAGSYQYTINNVEFFAGQNLEHDAYSVGVTAAQSIYSGGAVINRYKASLIEKEISKLNEELTYENIIHSADILYWTACANRDLLRLSEEFLRINQSLEKIVQERFDYGMVSRTDLLMIQSSTKDAEYSLSNIRNTYKISLQNLNIFMGKSPNAPIELSDSITGYVTLPVKYTYQNAIESRPEYSIASLNVKLQEKNINLTKSKYNPNLSIGFKEGWGTKMINIDGSNLFEHVAFAHLNIPLIRFGGRFSDVSAQKALLITKQLETQQVIDNIKKEMSNSWSSYVEYTRQIEIAQQGSQIAVRNLELNTLSYTEGKLPILDVLSAQQTWVQSYNRLINTWFNQKVAITDYNRAIGSGLSGK